MLAAGAMGVLLVMLTACGAPEPEATDLTIEEAKAIAQTGELLIAEQVPPAAVAEIEQREQGSLLSCEGDRNYVWAGHLTIHLSEDADRDAALQGIAEAITALDDWVVEPYTAASGEPALDIRVADGSGYIAAVRVDPARIQLSSFSPCFHLPEGESPLGDF